MLCIALNAALVIKYPASLDPAFCSLVALSLACVPPRCGLLNLSGSTTAGLVDLITKSLSVSTSETCLPNTSLNVSLSKVKSYCCPSIVIGVSNTLAPAITVLSFGLNGFPSA